MQESIDENSSIRNSILRQVADSWPSIKARLSTLSDDIQSEDSSPVYVSLMLLNSSLSHTTKSGSEELAFKRIFLAHLFDMIAFMCECGGEFMVDRIKSTVFPVIVTWFRHFGPRQVKPSPRQSSHPYAHGLECSHLIKDVGPSSATVFPVSSNTLKLRDSERRLFLSVIRCLTRILRQDDCGKALLSILPKAGLMLLPFLGFDDDVELEVCLMDCLKCILQIDCDILRRALLDLSGCSVPLCPIRSRIEPYGNRDMDLSTRVLTPACRGLNVLQATKCHDLLLFAETLAEQSLV
jgi:hypothetical protein